MQATTTALAEFALLAVRLCLGTVLVVVGVLLAWWLARWRHERLRQRDGAFALQVIQLVPMWLRLRLWLRGEIAPYLVYDPNANLGDSVVVTGHGLLRPEPAGGWEYQLRYQQSIEMTRRVQAAVPGDGVRALPWAAIGGGRDSMNAAAARLFAGAYDKPQPQIEMRDEPPPPVVEPVPVGAAFAANDRHLLAMGQTPAGAVIRWDCRDAPHLRFHGQTQGSGKTTAIKTLAAGAACVGHQVVILDRRRFKDWQDFRGRAELVDSRDPREFARAVLALRDIYQERDGILGQHGAPNIDALPEPPPRIVVVVAEFGALCATARDEGVLDDVLTPLSLILREAGAAGVHVLIEDQVVDQRWPRGISTNAEPVTGYLPTNYGAAGGYYGADKLPPYTFHYRGNLFRTWNIAPDLPELLASAPTIDGDVVHGERSRTFAARSPEVAPPSPPTNAPANGDPDGRWRELVANFLDVRPHLLVGEPRGISDIARLMASADGRTDWESYKSIAHRYYHDYRREYGHHQAAG